MPRGKAKPKTYDRYGLNVLHPVTGEILETNYFWNVDEIAQHLDINKNAVVSIINKRVKAKSLYDIYHIDKDHKRIEGLGKWKNRSNNLTTTAE